MVKEINKSFMIKSLLVQLFFGVVGLGLGCYWGISLDLLKYDHKLYKNIVIAGINVGTLTPVHARDSVQTEYIEKILQKKLFLTLEDQLFSASFKDFFIDSTLNEAVKTSYDFPNNLARLERWLFLLDDTEIKYEVTLHFSDDAINSFAEDIISKITQDASDAAISINADRSIAITPHLNGYIINKTTLVNQIKLSLSSYSESTIDILDFTNKSIPPRTTEFLETVDTCIASFNTRFTPNTGRAVNIELSSQAINGTFLAPGDTFSFNTSVGNTTAEKGYQYAPVIINSKISQGIGGGICQVSSTLYNAVLKSGLYPLNRKPHSKPVNYVPLGLDATVYFNSIDFEFINTLDFPIYMQSYIEEDQLYVNIYSNHRLNTRSYEVKSEVYQILPARVYYAVQETEASSTKMPVRVGSKGYKVKVIREMYEQDILKETEVISIDTYLPS